MLWKSREKLVLELVARVEKLERAWHDVEVEWDNVYDKIVRMNARLRERQRAIEKAEADGGEQAAPVATGSPPGRLLTPRQMELQQHILKRRAGG